MVGTYKIWRQIFYVQQGQCKEVFSAIFSFCHFFIQISFGSCGGKNRCYHVYSWLCHQLILCYQFHHRHSSQIIFTSKGQFRMLYCTCASKLLWTFLGANATALYFGHFTQHWVRYIVDTVQIQYGGRACPNQQSWDQGRLKLVITVSNNTICHATWICVLEVKWT